MRNVSNYNKAVYTAALVAGGWAGAMMNWAGAVMSWAGAVMSWAGAEMNWAGALKAVRILKVKCYRPTDRPTDRRTEIVAYRSRCSRQKQSTFVLQLFIR